MHPARVTINRLVGDVQSAATGQAVKRPARPGETDTRLVVDELREDLSLARPYVLRPVHRLSFRFVVPLIEQMLKLWQDLSIFAQREVVERRGKLPHRFASADQRHG